MNRCLKDKHQVLCSYKPSPALRAAMTTVCEDNEGQFIKPLASSAPLMEMTNICPTATQQALVTIGLFVQGSN